MARRLRVQFEGAIYYMTVRRSGRGVLFAEDANRGRVLDRLAESADLYEVRKYLDAERG